LQLGGGWGNGGKAGCDVLPSTTWAPSRLLIARQGLCVTIADMAGVVYEISERNQQRGSYSEATRVYADVTLRGTISGKSIDRSHMFQNSIT